MIIDIGIIIVSLVLIIIIITIIILRKINAFQLDPFGRKTELLTLDKNRQQFYKGREIGNISDASRWRNLRIIENSDPMQINELIRKNGNDENDKAKANQFTAIIGEFGKDTNDKVNFALKKGLEVNIISGPLINKKYEDNIITLLKNFPNFNMYVTESRPEKHFSIIGKDLFIELPHQINAPATTSFGIKSANEQTFKIFEEEFEKYREKSKKVTIEDIKKLSKPLADTECYD
jgi:hypothetical protein